MLKQMTLLVVAGTILAGCEYRRNVVPTAPPMSVEERALKWAMRLCYSIGYEAETEQQQIERRKCIARRYDQYIMKNG